MKKPNAQNVGNLERGRSLKSIRPSSLTRKLQTLRFFLEREALTNPTASVLLLELGRTLAGAWAA